MKDHNEYLKEAKEEVAKKHGYKSWFNSNEAALLALQNQASDLKKELLMYIEVNQHSFSNAFEMEKIIKYIKAGLYEKP